VCIAAVVQFKLQCGCCLFALSSGRHRQSTSTTWQQLHTIIKPGMVAVRKIIIGKSKVE
jgi:hypothetical protein